MTKRLVADARVFRHTAARVVFFSAVSYVVSFSAQLIDMFWLAKLGASVPTAMAIVATVFFLFLSINEVAGVGSVAAISQTHGSGDRHQTGVVIMQTLLLKAAFGAMMIGGFLLFLHYGVAFFTVDNDINGHIQDYGRVIWISLLLVPLNATLLTSMRIVGLEKWTAVVSVVALAVNATLTPLMIFGLFSVSGNGVAGAAWASVATEILVLGICLTLLLTSKKGVLFDCKSIRLDLSLYRYIVLVGLPIAGVTLLLNIEQALLARIVSLSPVAVSDGFGIAQRLFGLFFISTMGISIGVAVTTGIYVGRQKQDVIRHALPLFVVQLAVVFGLISLSLALAAPAIMGLFSADSVTIDTGTVYLRFMAGALILLAIQSAFVGTFEGAGRNLPVLVVIGAFYLLIEFPVLIAITILDPGNLTLVWFVVLLTSGLTAAGLYNLFVKSYWDTARNQHQ